MSNPMNKDQLNADLEKAKAIGSTRLERVRDILRDAMSQVMTEVKEGTGELRSIAKESTSAMRQPQPNPAASQSDIAPVEVVIEDSEPTTDSSLTSEAKSDETIVDALISPVQSSADIAAPTDELSKPQVAIVDVPVETPVVAAMESADSSTEGSAPAVDPVTTTSVELVNPAAESSEAATDSWMQQLLRLLQESEVGAKLHQQGAKLQEQLVQIDKTLSERYGDRYATLKKELIAAKAWYNTKRAEAEARGIDPVQQKQADYDVKVGEAGATIARKEQEIKRLLKELWQTVAKF